MFQLEVAPCNKKGREYTEADDKFVDSPDELVGKDVHFIFKIINCRGLPNKYTDVHCKYHVYLDTTEVTTEKISLTANPDFNHKKQFSFNPATRQLVDYLNNGSIMVQIVGKQYIRKSAVASKKGMSTKDMLKSDRAAFAKTANLMNGFQMNGRQVDFFLNICCLIFFFTGGPAEAEHCGGAAADEEDSGAAAAALRQHEEDAGEG